LLIPYYFDYLWFNRGDRQIQDGSLRIVASFSQTSKEVELHVGCFFFEKIEKSIGKFLKKQDKKS
jgi:hypothetical protein